MLTLQQALLYTVFIGIVTLFTRIFPFVLFKGKKSSDTLSFIEKYIPPAIMLILLVYCLKDIKFSVESNGLYQILCVGIAIITQIKFKNPLISIFGATGVYMILIRI